jgi:hypothetical protein
MLFRIILWSIIISFLFRFVFRFLLPLFQITGAAQERLRQMQKQMDEMQKKPDSNTAKATSKPRHVDGDYIEYEEVK